MIKFINKIILIIIFHLRRSFHLKLQFFVLNRIFEQHLILHFLLSNELCPLILHYFFNIIRTSSSKISALFSADSIS